MNRRIDKIAYLFLFPALIVIIIFRFYPIVQAIGMSLYNWSIAGPLKFIGFKNYYRLFIDPKFYQSLLNTFWYLLGVVPATVAISIFIAYLLNQKIKGQGIYRTIYFLPVVTSIVAISVVWKWIFNPDRGILNAVFHLAGLKGLKWLNDSRGIFELLFNAELSGFLAGPSIALISLMIMTIWHNLGYCIVICLAGLQNIPSHYYEAARIDGAQRWQLFWKITIPLLSPTIFYLLITQSIIAFNTFTPVYVMTQPPGGPLGTTSLVVYYLYEQAFRLWNLGYANAIAFVVFIIIFSLTKIQQRFLEQRVHYE
ncbi:MAG: sugar ABC transporter permease [candidate division WOR-3 bacterium]|nr:sugar ABC transporter permease [candidate division WOR-3 bacterium]